MSQPTAYVKSTNFAQEESANVGGRTTVRADRVDAELANIAQTLTETLANLSLLQRDDGQLRDALVELWNLSASCRAALATSWNARGLWATATAYVLGDMVDMGGSSYVCAIAHTSGTFATDYAAGKWQIFVAASAAGGVTFTPASSIAATNVQAAIEEVNTEARAAALPLFSALYGAL